jgi:hypothetical protein
VDHEGRETPPEDFTWLGRNESLRLLATVQAGRLIFTLSAAPTVQPVNFVVLKEHILLRAAASSAVAPAIHDSVVALEADGLDPARRFGWSVTVTGRPALVMDPQAVSRFRAAPLAPREARPDDLFVTISADLAEGRRVRLWPDDGGADPALPAARRRPRP